METSDRVIQTILSFVESHQFVNIKCVDDSELFMHKDGDIYRVSTNKRFKEDETFDYRTAEPLIEKLKDIRGYGIYKYEDYTPLQTFQSCGCDS